MYVKEKLKNINHVKIANNDLVEEDEASEANKIKFQVKCFFWPLFRLELICNTQNKLLLMIINSFRHILSVFLSLFQISDVKP